MTTSHPGLIFARDDRSASRRMRLALFLWTAFPIDRPAAIANLVLSMLLGSTMTTINGWAYVFPNRLTRLKSVELVRRNLRSNDLPSGQTCTQPFQFVFLT